jgi:hypothetical protein
MDCQKIAEEVYGLAKSDHLLAPLVEEALSVIDECLDTHGWVRTLSVLSLHFLSSIVD